MGASRFVGRVGTLAVMLGVGAGLGIAGADSAGATPAPSPSPSSVDGGDPRAGRSGVTGTATRSRDAGGPRKPRPAAATTVRAGQPDPAGRETESGDRAPRRPTAQRAYDSPAAAPKPRTATDPARVATAVNVGAPAPVAAEPQYSPAPAGPEQDPTTPVNPAVVETAVATQGIRSLPSPTADSTLPVPVESAVSFAALAAARRELDDLHIDQYATGPTAAAVAEQAAAPSFGEILQYTFAHRSPTASPAQSPGQSATGVVSGNLNAGTDNGAALVYTLAQTPANGGVVLATDGSYLYTPGDALAQSGGTDAFRVTIDNGAPFRLTGIGGAIQGIFVGLAQLIGLRQPDTITVTVPVSISAPSDISLDADGTLSLADLDTLARAGAVGATTDGSGRVTTLVGGFTSKNVDNADDALEVLNRIAGLLGAPGALNGDVTVQTTDFGADSGGVPKTFYRLHHEVNGVAVEGSEVILTALRDGTATGVFSGLDPRIFQVDTTPDAGLDETAEVLAVANQILRSRIVDPPAGLLESLKVSTTLVVHSLDPAAAPALAWRVDFFTDPAAESGPMLPTRTLYITANGADTGSLLDEDAGSVAALVVPDDAKRLGRNEIGLNGVAFTINYVDQGDTNAMFDTERMIAVLNGTQWLPGLSQLPDIGTIAESPDPLFGYDWRSDPSAVSAMGNAGLAYDYYNRLGAALPPVLRVGLSITPQHPPGGTFFPGGWWLNLGPNPGGGTPADGAIVFQDDAEVALDFVGHEMTHAVVASVVGKNGFEGFQGDALEESYADIMGSLIENKSGPDRWRFGEDATSVALGGVYRDMRVVSDTAPGSADYSYYDKSTEFSHAVYTMMTDPRAAEISNATWAQIFYSSINSLPKNADFLLARNTILGAALDQGLAGPQLKAIADAFNGAGIRVEDPRVKIVLRWGESPADLDAHLTGPGVALDRFHVYHDSPSFSPGFGADGVSLDYDASRSYGPESITLERLAPGDYYFYVHDATNRRSTESTALSNSGATVEVFTPDVLETDPTNIFGSLFRYITGQVPTTFEAKGSSPGTLWTVFKMTIPGGAGVPVPVLTPIDAYSYERNFANVGNQAPIVLRAVSDVNPFTAVVTGSVLGYDLDGDPLTYSVTDEADRGRVVVDPATGNFIYEPTRAAREAARPIYDLTTVVSGLNRPTRVVLGNAGTAYVVGAGAVTAVNTADNTIAGSTPTGPVSVGLVKADPSATRAYFTAYGSNAVGVFTPGTNTVAPFQQFGDRVPTAIGFSPDGTKVYVATVAADRTGVLAVIDASTGTQTGSVAFAGSASGMAVSPDGSRIYLAGNDTSGNGLVTVVNAATGATSTISGLKSPSDIAISPDGKRLFATTNSETGGALWAYSTQTNTVVSDVAVASGLAGYLAVSPDGDRVYVSTWDPALGTSTITVLNPGGTPLKVIDLPFNAMPYPTLSADGSRLYIADHESALWAISTANGPAQDNFVIRVGDGRGGNADVSLTVPIISL